MSILNKITPGPWILNYARWHKDGPAEGYIILSSFKGPDGKSREIAGLNVSTNTRIYHGNDNLKPPREYYFEPTEFIANSKSIAAVPEMLSILEKLSLIDADDEEKPDEVLLHEYNTIRIEAKKLLNQLNDNV